LDAWPSNEDLAKIDMKITGKLNTILYFWLPSGIIIENLEILFYYYYFLGILAFENSKNSLHLFISF
jgi:hypothetical protein